MSERPDLEAIEKRLAKASRSSRRLNPTREGAARPVSKRRKLLDVPWFWLGAGLLFGLATDIAARVWK